MSLQSPNSPASVPNPIPDQSMETAGLTPIRPGVTRVGWIGTGVMGAAMATRIQSAGYSLTVYARSPSKLPPGLSRRVASSPADLARSSDVVFTMLSHPSDVRSVLFGLLPDLPEGSALVDATSSDPELARRIAAAARSRNCHAVDAPVSGGDIGARDGTLAIFAGAHEESIVQHLSPLFNILGKVAYMGPPGSGQSAKIANQIAISGSVVGLSEALLFAKTAGLDEKGFLDAVREGAAGSKAMDLFGERVINRELGPGGFAEYLVKDLGMALDGAELALPGTALFQQLYLAMVANGDGKLGSHAVVTALERMNGKNDRKLQG